MKAREMELSKWIWIVSYIAVACLSSYGNALPILDTEEDFFPNEGGVSLDGSSGPSFFDPRSQDTVNNILKRGIFQYSEGYERYPRVNNRVIIPFYSYGNSKGHFRSKPRLLGRPRAYFGYTPWNTESGRTGNRFMPEGAHRPRNF